MVRRIRHGHVKNMPDNYCEYIIDTERDLDDIPKYGISAGSKAILNNRVYLLFDNNKWKYVYSSSRDLRKEYFHKIYDGFLQGNITEQYLNDSLLSIPINYFKNTSFKCIELDNATEVESGFLNECKCEELIIPNVTSLPAYTFKDCSNLRFIKIDNVESISEECFSNSGLEEFPIMYNITSLPTKCFSNCNNITTASSELILTLGAQTFSNCKNLSNINFPNATSISDNAFQNCISLKDVSLPNVTSIGHNVFLNCTSLTEVDLPNVTNMGINVFYNCSNLEHINLTNATNIPSNAFRNCTSLKSISLPSTTGIGYGTFTGCSNLLDIYLPNASNTYTNAPWGAVNATIHYECEFNEDGIPLELIEGD